MFYPLGLTDYIWYCFEICRRYPMKYIFEEMGGTYRQEEDYLIPNWNWKL